MGTVRLHRVIRTTPEKLYRAFTLPDALAKWLPPYGFTASYNPTFAGGDPGWMSPDHVGINQGPIPLMIENHRSDFLWRLMRSCRPVVTGLKRAGFTGGWLDPVSS